MGLFSKLLGKEAKEEYDNALKNQDNFLAEFISASLPA